MSVLKKKKKKKRQTSSKMHWYSAASRRAGPEAWLIIPAPGCKVRGLRADWQRADTGKQSVLTGA